jgi:ABC-type transporter Mla MlaB component
MAKITKTGEGYYLATPTSKDGVLGRNDCNQLKRELSQIIKSHREISIDVRGIKSINREGLKILQEMQHLADQKECKLKYINVDLLIQHHLAGLSEKKVTLQDEF